MLYFRRSGATTIFAALAATSTTLVVQARRKPGLGASHQKKLQTFVTIDGNADQEYHDDDAHLYLADEHADEHHEEHDDHTSFIEVKRPKKFKQKLDSELNDEASAFLDVNNLKDDEGTKTTGKGGAEITGMELERKKKKETVKTENVQITSQKNVKTSTAAPVTKAATTTKKTTTTTTTTDINNGLVNPRLREKYHPDHMTGHKASYGVFAIIGGVILGFGLFVTVFCIYYGPKSKSKESDISRTLNKDYDKAAGKSPESKRGKKGESSVGGEGTSYGSSEYYSSSQYTSGSSRVMSGGSSMQSGGSSFPPSSATAASSASRATKKSNAMTKPKSVTSSGAKSGYSMTSSKYEEDGYGEEEEDDYEDETAYGSVRIEIVKGEIVCHA
ncbi:unnamed protein product [Amoebophrya sp. A120]|nr:unnamed protein product [Amoebophrya sp. A120]|eukprot:GSA120T00024529001.1